MAKMNRPEIAAARANLDVAKLTDAAVDSDLRPTVQLSGSFGSQVSPTSFVNEQRQIDASNAAAVAAYVQEKTLFPSVNFPPPTLIPPVVRRVPGFWQFQILSNFTIPLYDFGQRAAAHHAARAQIDATLAGLFNAYDTVDADVASAARNVDAAAQKLALAKQSAQLGRETARIAQLQYKNGLISLNDATQTEQTALSAESDLISARVGYVTALIRLRVALAPPNPAAAADLRGL
jgi:outer membrane protein TolC